MITELGNTKVTRKAIVRLGEDGYLLPVYSDQAGEEELITDKASR